MSNFPNETVVLFHNILVCYVRFTDVDILLTIATENAMLYVNL